MRKKIVTIDDEKSVRYLIRSSLKDRSYRIYEAENGAEGLALIEKRRPDLVILDVVMPVKNGIDTLMELRARPEFSDTPVLLLTGVKDARKLDPLLSLGPTDLLAKPFLVEVLRYKVAQMLGEDLEEEPRPKPPEPTDPEGGAPGSTR